jgi:hypothetical protein
MMSSSSRERANAVTQFTQTISSEREKSVAIFTLYSDKTAEAGDAGAPEF